MPTRRCKTPLTTVRKKKAQVRIQEVEPKDEFEEELVKKYGFKKIKKTRSAGKYTGLRTTHRFVTPTGEEIEGKIGARQYIHNLKH
ncbi:hypothetical protein N9A45_00815 [bacterium]|nr:hypothetical protein [bacterium]